MIVQEVYGGFKRDKIANNANVTNDDNAPSFKNKSNLITYTEANGTKRSKNSFTI